MITRGELRPKKHVPTCLILLVLAGRSGAAGLDVSVVDDDGRPVQRVTIHAVPSVAAPRPASAPTAVMDQANNAFVPHVLVVQTGTAVLFPNSDTVSHHVYSFSDAKPFELPLYKGNVHPPLVFDKPGIVVLGCNIHDGMLGYIRVVDTPYFATTDASGVAKLDGLPAGKYTVYAWTPRLRPADAPAGVAVELHDERQDVAFLMAGKLLPEHDHGGSGLTWQRY